MWGFIDLQKAFDTVDYQILLHKLSHYGIRGVFNKWFCSYLNERTQITQVGSHISKRELLWCATGFCYESSIVSDLY